MDLDTMRCAIMTMINLSRDFLAELEPTLATAAAIKLNDFEWSLDIAYLDSDRQEMLRVLHSLDAFSENLLIDLRKAAT